MNKRSNGEGSIGKRKNGTWYGAIRIDGKQKWVYGDTRKEVVDKIRQIQQKHEEGLQLNADKVTLADFITKWLDEVSKQRNKPYTYKRYKRIAELHINPVLGNIPITVLRPDTIQKHINKLSEQGKSPGSIRNIRAVLRIALNQAMRWRYINYNPATLVTLPRMEKYEIKPLTKAEAQQFISIIKGHRLEALYLMTLLLGLREGEVLGLLLSNIDLEKGLVRIDGSLQADGAKITRTTTKTKSSIRTLPLPASLIPLLCKHVEQQRQQHPLCEYLFASRVGKPIRPYNLVRQFKGLLKKAGLRDIRFHDLRHSCATFLITQGEHPRTVMEILGHSQISITMDIYAHVLQETKTNAIAGIDGFLMGSS
jgi:integrase